MRLALLPLALALAAPLAAQTSPWQLEPSETTADLRGIHAVGGGVVWASGTGGTVLRSEDSGFEWQQCAIPPGAEKLDFRAIWGFDDHTAIVMSSGPGPQSRLYKTTDGCAHWTQIAANADPSGFWDGLVFSDRSNGYLLGDPVDGQLFLEQTIDGGSHWTRIQAKGLDVGSRGAFAASNSALVMGPGVLGTTHGIIHVPWISTGGPGGALILSGGIECGMETAHANPYACLKFWDFDQYKTPLAGATASQGVFSIGYRGEPPAQTAIAVGGDYAKPAERTGTAAWWNGSSQGWQPATALPGGYRSTVAYDAAQKVWVAAGPNGSDISHDDGYTWQPLEHAPAGLPKGGEWNALSLPWAVGPHGRIGKLNADAIGGISASTDRKSK